MEKLPHWSLETIYPGIESDEFNADLAALAPLAKEVEGLLEGDLIELLDKYQLMLETGITLMAYTYALHTVNTGDEKALRGVSRVEEALLELQRIHVAFVKTMGKRQAEVAPLIAEGGELHQYKFVLEEIIENERHTMSDAEEALAADLSRSGSDAFSRLQQAISSQATNELNGEKKTTIELRALAFDADRKVRQAAFEKELEVFKEHATSFAYALNGVKGTTISLNKRRGYASPLAESLKQARISEEILNLLIGTIEENLPHFRRYLKAKAHALGIEKLAFYDLFAPLGGEGKKYTFEEGRAIIVDLFTKFHPPMGEFADQAYAKNWIDSEPREGKVGGAYCTSFPLRKETRILANWDGSYNSVRTVAHEMGHSYHDYVTSELPILLNQYPMTLAETASIFSELLIFEGALEGSSDQERIPLIEDFLQDATQTCVDILSRFYFEKEFFERRAEGDLTPSQINAIMLDAQKRSYGDGLDPEALHPYMWAVKGHYYRSSLSFYNFPYAFGLLFGLGVYQKGKGESDFAQRYDELLHYSAQNSAEEVAASASLDITKKEFWQGSMAIVKQYVDEFCRLVSYEEEN